MMSAIRCLNARLTRVAPLFAARIARELYLRPAKVRQMNSAESTLFDSARKSSIQFRGQNIDQWQWGDANAPRILLVHGWGVGPAFFAPLIETLISAEFQPITYMALGHGKSMKRRTTAMTLVHLYREVFSSLDSVYATVGHSLGAGTIISSAHFGLIPDRVVLLSPVSDLVESTEQFGAHIGFSPDVMEKMRALIWEEFSEDCDSLCDGWESLYDARLDVPTLIFHDVADPLLDISHAKRVQTRWAKAELRVTEGEGHFRTARSKDAHKEILEFLQPKSITNDNSKIKTVVSKTQSSSY